MFTKGKRRATALLLTVMMVATTLVGYASASGGVVEEDYPLWWFYLDLPAYGITDLATPRTKDVTKSYAAYDLRTVNNNSSGYNLWVNVRSKNGATIVGTAQTVSTAKKYYVSYLSGYGNVGTQYRPSGQTNSHSAKTGYIAGYWTP